MFVILMFIVMMSGVVPDVGATSHLEDSETITGTIGGIGDELGETLVNASLGDAAPSFLDEAVHFDAGYMKFVRFFFQLPEATPIDWRYFIIFISLWIMLFVLISEAVGLISFFSGKAASLFASFLIVSVVALSNMIDKAALMVIGFTEFNNFLGGKTGTELIVGLITLVLIFLGFQKLMSGSKKDNTIEKIKQRSAQDKMYRKAEKKDRESLLN